MPQPVLQRLRASPCIEIQATTEARLAFLLRDYANLGDDPALLVHQLGTMRELHGNAVIARWQAWAEAQDLAPLFAELMALHYDPLYARSQSKNLFEWAQRQTVCTDDLTPAGIGAVADQVLKLQAQ